MTRVFKNARGTFEVNFLTVGLRKAFIDSLEGPCGIDLITHDVTALPV